MRGGRRRERERRERERREREEEGEGEGECLASRFFTKVNDDPLIILYQSE